MFDRRLPAGCFRRPDGGELLQRTVPRTAAGDRGRRAAGKGDLVQLHDLPLRSGEAGARGGPDRSLRLRQRLSNTGCSRRSWPRYGRSRPWTIGRTSTPTASPGRIASSTGSTGSGGFRATIQRNTLPTPGASSIGSSPPPISRRRSTCSVMGQGGGQDRAASPRAELDDLEPGAFRRRISTGRIDTMIHKTGGSRESYCRVLIEAYAYGVVPIVERGLCLPRPGRGR